MKKRFNILIEDDWEVMGNGLGNVAQLQYLPSMFFMKLAKRLGIKLNKRGKTNTSSSEKLVLYSPFYLKSNYNLALTNDSKILDVENFRSIYTALYWNSIWYFKLKDLNYNFM